MEPVLGLDHETGVEDGDLALLREAAQGLPQKVCGITEIVPGLDRLVTQQVADGGGSEACRPAEDSRRTPPLGVEIGFFGFRDKARSNRQHGPVLGQRMGMDRDPFKRLDRRTRRPPPPYEFVVPFGQLAV